MDKTIRELTEKQMNRFDGYPTDCIIDTLLDAEEIIEYYADVLQIRCRMKKHDDGKKAIDYIKDYISED